MVLNPWHISNYWSNLTEYVRDREECVFIMEDMDDYINSCDDEYDLFPAYLSKILQGKKVDRFKSPHLFTLNRTLNYREKKAVQANPQLIGHYEFTPLPRTRAEQLAESLVKQLPDRKEVCLGDIYHGIDKT